jgi:hypothetical protein
MTYKREFVSIAKGNVLVVREPECHRPIDHIKRPLMYLWRRVVPLFVHLNVDVDYKQIAWKLEYE